MRRMVSMSILVVSLAAVVLAIVLSVNGRYERIAGRSSDEVAENFLVLNDDIDEGQQNIETRKSSVGDGWTSYSYILEDEDGEQVYIDNAVVLPDEGYTYRDLGTGNLVSERAHSKKAEIVSYDEYGYYTSDDVYHQYGVSDVMNDSPYDDDGYIKEEYRGTSYGNDLVEDGGKFRP